MTDMMYTAQPSNSICMKGIRKREISISTTAMAELMGKSRRSSRKYSIFWKCVLCVVRKLRVSKIMNIILTEILRGKIKIPGVFLRVSI